MPPPDPPRDRLDEIEASLPLADPWERPTETKRRRIEQSGPPVSYPPPSTATLVRDLRAWGKANALLVALVVGTGGGGAVLPWRDWLGLATVAALQAEAKRNDEARKAQDAATARELKRARDAAFRAAQRVEELESQLVAQKVLVESLGTKRRGR